MTEKDRITTPNFKSLLSDDSENSEVDIYSDEAKDDDVNPLERALIKSILGKSDRSINGSYEIIGESPIRSTERKEVSFNIAPGSADSSVADIDKSRDELYAKLDKVEMKLTQAEIDLSAEKTMRKKKERNLIKLAKELNKRAVEQENRESEITRLKEEVATNEAKLAATRKELDERIATNEENGKVSVSELNEAQKRFREAALKHDAKMAELTKAHTLEMDTLRSQMKGIENDKENLESKLSQMQNEMTAKGAESDKALLEQKAHLAAAQQKYREAVEGHDLRSTEQSRAHSEQTEELRRQLLVAHLEADKIRTQLASIEMMDATPEEASRIVERTMRASFATPSSESNKKADSTQKVFNFFGLGAIAFFVIAYQMRLLSMDSFCSPVIPGKHLEKEMVFEAPWWAPAPMKDKAFELICESRIQTSMRWQTGRLIITNKEGKVLLEKRSPSVIIYGDVINFVDKKGKVETLKTPWSN